MRCEEREVGEGEEDGVEGREDGEGTVCGRCDEVSWAPQLDRRGAMDAPDATSSGRNQQRDLSASSEIFWTSRRPSGDEDPGGE